MNTENNTTTKDLAQKLLDYPNLVLVTHTHPDPDAYGSICGLALALKNAGRNVTLVNESAPVEGLNFFPLSSEITSTFPKGDTAEYPVVITLDCGDEKRVGDSLVGELMDRDWEVINIDHHISNNFFGSTNFVRPDYSSTCEIIYHLLDAALLEITPEVAQTLLTGIVADTGSLRYSSASAETFRVAANLVEAGANQEEIGKKLYGQVKLSTVKLLSEVLLNLHLYEDGKVAVAVVPEELLKKHGAGPDATDSLSERTRDIEGVLVSAAIRQYEDMWKVSLRSKDERINVSDIAAKFGGGGHRQAAAFRWKKDLEELQNELLIRLTEAVK